ncbi:MAG: tetratricopeptide repeat protein [Bacteroidota bacterium]
MRSLLFFFCVLLFHTILSGQQSQQDKIDSLCSESILYADSLGNKAVDLAQEAIKLAKVSQDSCRLANPYYSMGVALHSKSKYKRASKNYLKAFEVAESCKNDEIAVKISNNLGILYRMTEQYDVSASWYKKALKFSRINGDVQGQIQALNNLGSLYGYQDDNKKALSYFRESLDLMEAHPEENQEEASVRINIGWILYALDKKAESMQAYNAALNVLEENPDPYARAVCLKNMGEIFLEEGNFQQAYDKLKAAEPLYEQFDNKSSKADLFHLLYQAELGRQKHKAALDYLEKYQALQDSINTRDMHALLADIQAKYDNERLKKEKLQQEQELDRRRNFIIIGALLLSLLLILLLFFLRINHIRKRNNKILSGKNKTIQEGLGYGRYVKEKIMKHCPANVEQYLRDYFILDMPRDIVGGDFYMLREKHGAMYVLVGDATGHGIPGGFISQNCLYLFDDAIQAYSDPEDIINDVIKRWDIQSAKAGDYDDGFTVSLVKIQPGRKAILALWKQKAVLKKDRETQTLRHSRFKTKSGASVINLALKPGNMLILTSDGFYDQLSEKEEKTMKFARFRELLENCRCDTAENMKQCLLDAFYEHKSNQVQTDDVMVAGMMF